MNNKNLRARNPLTIPQTEKSSEKQVKNNAGGYVFQVTPETQLKRFLIIGSTGSYYQPSKKMTDSNLVHVEEMWRKNPKETAQIIRDISKSGRAPNNDYALAALAVGIGMRGDARLHAFSVLDDVARIGTHILHLADFLKHRSGWGRSVRSHIANWYLGKTADKLAYQVLKYQSRDGWSHKDLLSMCHALHNKTPMGVKNVLEYIMHDKITPELTNAVSLIDGYEKIKKATTVDEVVALMTKHNMPRELVPTQWLNEKAVWQVLLDGMVKNNLLEALIRNLNKVTALDMFKKKENLDNVVAVITSAENLKMARLHPLKILIAMKQYSQGRGDKGSLTWTPVKKIEKALEDAFYASFDFVEPTGKNIMMALDVSGSMASEFYHGMSCFEAEVCLAMVTARTEKNHHMMKFHGQFVPIPVNPHGKLQDIINLIYDGNFGRTDCSLPMQYAIHHELDIDTFVVYTDSETWAGIGAPVEWLKKYRSKMNKPNAQLVVVAFTSTGFSIADPNDPGMLDVAGFDVNIAQILHSFICGEF